MSQSRQVPTTMDSAILVLSIVKQGGTIPGRTSLQKISYFTNEVIGSKIAFKPHLYGPFSPEVAASSDVLVSARLLKEEIERGSFVRSGREREWTRHSYSLTPDGQRYYDWMSSKKPELPEARIGELISKLREETDLDPDALSKLAKVHFVRKSCGVTDPSPVIISKAAKLYGWNVPVGVVRQSLITMDRLAL